MSIQIGPNPCSCGGEYGQHIDRCPVGVAVEVELDAKYERAVADLTEWFDHNLTLVTENQNAWIRGFFENLEDRIRG